MQLLTALGHSSAFIGCTRLWTGSSLGCALDLRYLGSVAALGNLGQGLAVPHQRACWDGSRAEYLFGGMAPAQHHLSLSVVPSAVVIAYPSLTSKKEQPLPTTSTELPPRASFCNRRHWLFGHQQFFRVFTPFGDHVERLRMVDISLVLVSSSQYGISKLIPHNFHRQQKIPT